MTRRPRGVNRSYWFHGPREWRRVHVRCCIGSPHICPLCCKLDHDCEDSCGCYRRDPEGWRKASALADARALAGREGP